MLNLVNWCFIFSYSQTSCHSSSNIGLKNGGQMNSSASSMDVYKVSEDGGSFRLPGLDELPGKWILGVKTF